MGDELRSQSWIFDMFIGVLSRLSRSSEFSEFFNKIPVRILLDVIFCVFRFSKASLNALTSSLIKFQTSRRMAIVLGTFTYSRARSIGL